MWLRRLSTAAVRPAHTAVRPEANDRVFVAMLLGVDSSMCAHLARGFRTTGIYMANWAQTAGCVEDEWRAVQRVARHVGIPCERVLFEQEYWTRVFEPMLESYRNGDTPNPDVGCNRYVKFGAMIGALHERMQGTGERWWLATGHYAQTGVAEDGSVHLLRGANPAKDQSYYLSTMPPEVLPHVWFPVGGMEKKEVRRMAREAGIPTADKPDSQGLCFVLPTGSFREFLNEYLEPNPGEVVSDDGVVHGKHQGLWHATVGQKSGYCLPQGDPRYQGVWYVGEKRKESNQLVLVRGSNNPRLFSKRWVADEWRWMGDPGELWPEELTVQYRSLQEPCQVTRIEVRGNEVEVEVEGKSRGVCSGQNLVLYRGDRVLGGGVIRRVWLGQQDEDAELLGGSTEHP